MGVRHFSLPFWAAPLAIALLFSGFVIASARHMTPAPVELRHVEAADALLARRAPPPAFPGSALLLNAAPLRIASHLSADGAAARWLRSAAMARAMTLLYSLALLFLVWRWADEWFGAQGANIAVLSLAIHPTFLGFSSALTPDVATALFTMAALYLAWRFDGDGGRLLDAALSGGAAGLALACSPMAFAIVPVAFALVLRAPVGRRRRAMVFLLAGFMALNTAQMWTGVAAAQWRYFLAHGIDEAAPRFVYALGELQAGRVPWYFVVAAFFKTSLFSLALVTWAVAVMWRSTGEGRERFMLYILTPVLALFSYASLVLPAPYGHRFLLSAAPLIALLVGALSVEWRSGVRARALIAAGFIGAVSSVASYFPHVDAYMNELVFSRATAYRFLADANLDLGRKEAWRLAYEMATPELTSFPRVPTAGRLLVDVDGLVGIRGEGSPAESVERYRWLRENYVPVSHVAHAYLVFDVPEADVPALQKRYGFERTNDPAVKIF